MTASSVTDFKVNFDTPFSDIPEVVFVPMHNSNVNSMYHKLKSVTADGFTGCVLSSGGGTHVIHWIAVL